VDEWRLHAADLRRRAVVSEDLGKYSVPPWLAVVAGAALLPLATPVLYLADWATQSSATLDMLLAFHRTFGGVVLVAHVAATAAFPLAGFEPDALRPHVRIAAALVPLLCLYASATYAHPTFWGFLWLQMGLLAQMGVHGLLLVPRVAAPGWFRRYASLVLNMTMLSLTLSVIAATWKTRDHPPPAVDADQPTPALGTTAADA
jgi:hypothetical protein